tara:strand:- start:9 stop:920 length:912 start_codon:yes stop_codon:yes gene_type:complete
MIEVKVDNEYSRLKSVVLGNALDMGDPPEFFDAFDPRSLYHIKNNSFPNEKAIVAEVNSFYNVLKKHNIEVYRPTNIHECNQVFARDLGFVISNIFFQSNIVENRKIELNGLNHILKNINVGVVKLPEFMHIEGGDVILHDDKVFIGTYSGKDYSDLITARTNKESINYLSKMLPNKEIIPIEINKSNSNIFDNILHLDCCFQPIGEKNAIICPDGFSSKDQLDLVLNIFGENNVYMAYGEEAFNLASNLLVLSPKVIVSDKRFKNINAWLTNLGYLVEKISYSNVAKMSGLFRCSTLPLLRE